MLTFHSILNLYGIDPAKVRLVRHTNKEIQIMEAFHNNRDRFVEYASWQAANRYGDSDYVAMFSSTRGTKCLFLGIWNVSSIELNNELTEKHFNLLKKYELPEQWFEKASRYQLDYNETMSDLSERLIIEWGKSAVTWVQKQDKPVIEIRGLHSIGDFISYDDVQLPYGELKQLIKNPDTNPTWINALSSVNGVYLILNNTDGRLYVGSAYGAEGFWGRWKNYAQSGHGGNKLLKDLNPDNFIYSILEISPGTASADEVIARENRWKERIGSRKFGLNDN